MLIKSSAKWARSLGRRSVGLWLIAGLFLLACNRHHDASVDSGGDRSLVPEPLDDSGAQSTGCGTSLWGTGTYTIERAGVERRFRVYVPSIYDPATPAPLVLAFHGWGGDGGEFIDDPLVVGEADTRGFVVVAPDGLGADDGGSPASWSFRGSTTGLDGDGANATVPGDSPNICDDEATNDYVFPSCVGVAQNGCSWTQCVDDDVEFVRQLVALAQANLCIDPGRVYAMGGSNGGMFTWELAQNGATANLFTAIAPIIGLPHRGYLSGSARDGGTPALLITGTRDRTVPPGEWDDPTFTTTTDGDVYYYTGATAITRVWAESAGCSTAAPATPVDLNVEELDCRSYCAGSVDLPPVLDCRASMGHTYSFSWSLSLILRFFEEYG